MPSFSAANVRNADQHRRPGQTVKRAVGTATNANSSSAAGHRGSRAPPIPIRLDTVGQEERGDHQRATGDDNALSKHRVISKLQKNDWQIDR
jgi:hypothetical protein